MSNTVQNETAFAPELKKNVLSVLVGLALAFGMTLAMLLLLAAVAYFGDIGDGFLAPIATGISLLFLFFSVRIVSKGARGFLFGAVVGLLYYVILYICALSMFAEFNFSVRTAVFMLIGILTGGLGGLVGKSAPEKRSKHRKKKK